MVSTWLRTEEELEANITEICSRVTIVMETVSEEVRSIQTVAADIQRLETDDTELKVGQDYQ